MTYKQFVMTRQQLAEILFTLRLSEVTIRHAGLSHDLEGGKSQVYARTLDHIHKLEKELAADPKYDEPAQFAKLVS